METKKIKPVQIVVLILGALLTISVFLFQGEIKEAIGFTDINAPYREQYKTYESAKAEVVSANVSKGKRGSRTTLKVQFRDKNDNLITGEIDQNGLSQSAIGDSITIFYNPEQSQSVVSEASYKEIMGK